MSTNIGESYAESIGLSYSDVEHDLAMRKAAENPGQVETSLDRIYRAARIKLGREPTQAEIAKAAGVSQPTVSEWRERPGGGPRMKNALRLAAWIGITVDYIYNGTEPMFSGPVQDKRLAALLDAWPHLDEFDQGVLLGEAKAAIRKKQAK